MNKLLTLTVLLLTLALNAEAQDELLAELETLASTEDQEISYTFKDTRIINGHSVELRKPGTMLFLISHRFGRINSGAYNLWGIDNSNIRFALEYAPINNLMFGFGRSSFEKTFDGFLKYRILSQKKGEKNTPVTLTWLSSISLKTQDRIDNLEINFGQKMASTHQLLMARKFNSNFSAQITPTFVQYGIIEADESQGNVIAVGLGGRYKISNRVAINAEYYPQLSNKGSQYYDSFAIGVDIETGGHVFQLHLTNANAMIEKGFIGETQDDFFNGDIHLGFNISRVFQVAKNE